MAPDRTRGAIGSADNRASGRPSRLNPEQLRSVAELYQAGPRDAGFDADRWTTVRFAKAILTRFGVRYDPDHVGRIMHRLGLRTRRRRAEEPLAMPLLIQRAS